MDRERITQKQAVCIIAMFELGSSLVLGISSESMQDSWMGLVGAFAGILPVLYVYTRLMSRFPGKDLFEISLTLFGRVAGRIVIALYIWYAFHLGALVLRNFSEFINVRVFEMMPQTVSLLLMILIVIWVSKRGVEVLGRWSSVTLPIVLILVAAVTLLLAKDMKPAYLMPVGENLFKVPKDMLNTFAFPLGESVVLLLAVMGSLKPGVKPGRTLLYGMLIGWGTLLVSLFRNILTLGFPVHNDKWFPSYDAASVIISGSFISRIENVVGANFLLAGFVKISVCVLAASKGTARLVGAPDYRPYVAPIGLVMAAMAEILYVSIMEMFEFIDIYPYYAMPFQLLLPVVLCVTAEIRFLIKGKKEKGGAPGEAPAG